MSADEPGGRAKSQVESWKRPPCRVARPCTAWLGDLRWPGDFALPVVVGVVQVAGSYFSDWHRHLQLGPAGWPAGSGRWRWWSGAGTRWRLYRWPLPPLSAPGTTPGFLSLIVAFFVAATSGHRRAAWASIVGGFVWSVWLGPLVYEQKPASASFALALGAWLVVLVVVAEAVRMAHERRAERQSGRELEARRLASEERLRMARDLHDVIGHNISLISIQAGVGLDLMEAQPEQARAALVAIKAVSKEALGELRAMLNALRRDDEEAPRSPARGLDRLGELVQLTKAAGLSVTTEVVGMPHPLPASVDLAGYRIVQESLTNVARHAPGATATVRIAYEDGDVLVEVVDDGGPSVGNAGPNTGNVGTGTGSGIAGMERARALGGDLVTGAPFARRLRSKGALALGGEPMIRVLLADDQALVRAGLRALLDARQDIEVVGEAADGKDAVSLAKTLLPDVLLMDIRMPGTDGLEATRQIMDDPRLSDVRVVILTTFGLDEYLFEALHIGAFGFLVKDAEPEDLVNAVRVVAHGDSLISPALTRRLIAEFASRAKAPRHPAELDVLTEREREVMALVGDGSSNDEIPGRLFMSPATARTHVSRAMTKLGPRDRTQLVVLAYETGLVRPGWLT